MSRKKFLSKGFQVSIGPGPRFFIGKSGGLFSGGICILFAAFAVGLAAQAPIAAERKPAERKSGGASDRASILAPTTDFSKSERWEDLPGGTATNRTRFDADAFSQPSAGLSFEERAKFSIGNGMFRRTWVTAPSPPSRPTGSARYSTRAAARIAILRMGAAIRRRIALL